MPAHRGHYQASMLLASFCGEPLSLSLSSSSLARCSRHRWGCANFLRSLLTLYQRNCGPTGWRAKVGPAGPYPESLPSLSTRASRPNSIPHEHITKPKTSTDPRMPTGRGVSPASSSSGRMSSAISPDDSPCLFAGGFGHDCGGQSGPARALLSKACRRLTAFTQKVSAAGPTV